jgi:hypothetical protein
MMACSWLERWWHRRRRMQDIEELWRALRARADTLEEARLAWDLFLQQAEQGHWRCACGAPIQELFRQLTITVSE